MAWQATCMRLPHFVHYQWSKGRDCSSITHSCPLLASDRERSRLKFWNYKDWTFPSWILTYPTSPLQETWVIPHKTYYILNNHIKFKPLCVSSRKWTDTVVTLCTHGTQREGTVSPRPRRKHAIPSQTIKRSIRILGTQGVPIAPGTASNAKFKVIIKTTNFRPKWKRRRNE